MPQIKITSFEQMGKALGNAIETIEDEICTFHILLEESIYLSDHDRFIIMAGRIAALMAQKIALQQISDKL